MRRATRPKCARQTDKRSCSLGKNQRDIIERHKQPTPYAEVKGRC